MSDSTASLLATLDEAYEETSTDDIGQVPDGEYDATIVKSYVEETSWQTIQWTAQFQTPKGRVTKWSTLDDRDRLSYVKYDLTLLGYTGKLSDLVEQAPGLVGLTVKLTVKSNVKDGRTYKNVYLNELTGRDEQVTAQANATAPPPQPAAAGGDDIPFAPTGGWWGY